MIPENIQRRIRLHVYGKSRIFFAIVQPGFENTALEEMTKIGFDRDGFKILEGGLEFKSNIKDVWKLHLLTRTVTRVLMRIEKFKAVFFNKYCEYISEIPWELHLVPGQSIGFKIKCRHSKLYHTDRLTEETVKGINLRLSRFYKDRDSGIRTDGSPGSSLFIRIDNDICSVSLDCTGDPLYRRNFRIYTEKAPLRETLASCMLLESEASSFDAVVDPMCGSGVIPVEAGMIACGVLPGMRRNFAFEEFPGFSMKAFVFMKKKLTEEYESSGKNISIFAGDIDNKAVETTQMNIDNAGFRDYIKTACTDFFATKKEDFSCGKILLISNPPYGERIKTGNTADFYRKLGMKFRKDFKGCSFAVIIPGMEAEKAFGLSHRKKIIFFNGGIPVSLVIGEI
jgi:putative N6-adenine-specific DNA methylase